MVLGSPLQDQGECHSWQAAFHHVERTDIDQRFVLGIERVEMWRPMITPKNLDQDAIKRADRRPIQAGCGKRGRAQPACGALVRNAGTPRLAPLLPASRERETAEMAEEASVVKYVFSVSYRNGNYRPIILPIVRCLIGMDPRGHP